MLSTLDCHFGVSPQTLYFPRFSGGDDGARTRDLCRDSLALIGFSTTYRLVRDAEIITSQVRIRLLWVEKFRPKLGLAARPCLSPL